MVKELRDRTGAGMMDCKTALTETNGDLEAAIDWLRKKGLSKAAKKADRVAAEGLIGIVTAGNKGAVTEVNSETDFVSRNEQFQTMVRGITSLAPQANGDLAELLSMELPGAKTTVENHLKDMVATIGENMSLRRTAALAVAEGVVADYVHNKYADDLGKIGVLVALEGKGDAGKMKELGRQIAMHIAARNPVALDLASVPADIVAREKAIIMDKNQGKPANVLEKIADSAMKTFAKENCLLEQTFVLDEAKTVTQVLKDAEKAVGGAVKLAGYVRFALGEGIEKKKEDFAAEVAAAVGGGR
jgi:elongation factor Ts